MKRWFHRGLCVAALFAAIAAGCYEAATHNARGWLRGEAIYEGRPTSYWRAHCDDWLARFDNPVDAAQWVPMGISVPAIDVHLRGRIVTIQPVQKNWWRRGLAYFHTPQERLDDDWPPKVLFGFPGSEPVLEDLEREPEYRLVAERALRHAKVYRKMDDDRKR